MPGLPGNRGSVGAVAGASCDKAGAEGVTAQFGQRGGVVTCMRCTASDGLMDRSPGQR